jgi:hypothetical protein
VGSLPGPSQPDGEWFAEPARGFTVTINLQLTAATSEPGIFLAPVPLQSLPSVRRARSHWSLFVIVFMIALSRVLGRVR